MTMMEAVVTVCLLVLSAFSFLSSSCSSAPQLEFPCITSRRAILTFRALPCRRGVVMKESSSPSASHHNAAYLRQQQQQQQQLPSRRIKRVPTMLQPRDAIHVYSTLVAGAASGALASIICAPLDLIRTRLQVWGDVKHGQHGTVRMIPQMLRDIVRAEGLQGCFRGLGATLVTVPVFWGVYFPLYDDMKRHLNRRFPETNHAWIHMSSAVAAGGISDVICNPMFVVRTRLQTEALHSKQKRSMLQTARALYQEAGPFIFWRGMTANLLGLTHVGVQFPVYEQLKQRFRQDKEYATAMDLLLASALSKISASCLTYPHEVIRSRMMDARTKASFFSTCRRIYGTEGWLGFYAGLPVSIVRVIPNACITFLTYELFSRWARNKIRDRQQNKLHGSS